MSLTNKRCKFRTFDEECRRRAVITRWRVSYTGKVSQLYYCLDHGTLDVIQRMTHPNEEDAYVASVTKRLLP